MIYLDSCAHFVIKSNEIQNQKNPPLFFTGELFIKVKQRLIQKRIQHLHRNR